MMAGLAVALLPRYAVWRQLQAGRVQEVLAEWEAEGLGDSVYMLTAPSRYPTLATRTLIDFIRMHLERQAESWGQSAKRQATTSKTATGP